MPTLHMEVEAARAAQKSLQDGYGVMDTTFKGMINAVNGLESGAWVGNSATEFFQVFGEFKSTVSAKIEELNNLQMRLSAEITEWENMAQKLG
jgi:uncharacterized protein YukE